MNAILSVLFTVIQTLLPLIVSNSKATSSVIQALVDIMPTVIKEATDVLPMVQDIIGGLSKADGVTDDDMAKLEEMSQQVDDAFEAAVAAKETEV
jgi:hypothetical protein